MEIRQAKADDLPLLRLMLEESGGELIDLDMARVWVAVDGGQIVGMLPLRLVWQAEPLLVWSGTKSGKRRAGLALHNAALRWLGGSENRTGIRWLFGITRSRAVAGWLRKLGWRQQYIGAKTFIRHTGGGHGI